MRVKLESLWKVLGECAGQLFQMLLPSFFFFSISFYSRWQRLPRCVADYIALHCIALSWMALYCIVLYCIVLYCIVLYCIVLYYIALHCIALHCIALHCIALHCIELHWIELYLFQKECRWYSKEKCLRWKILNISTGKRTLLNAKIEVEEKWRSERRRSWQLQSWEVIDRYMKTTEDLW